MIKDGLLYHQPGEGRVEQLVVPKKLREQVLAMGHKIPWAGHLKTGTHRPNRWTSEAFGETQTRSGCMVCSAASEAFRAARMLSAQIERAKSEEVGRWMSEPLDSLIGCVPTEWPF